MRVSGGRLCCRSIRAAVCGARYVEGVRSRRLCVGGALVVSDWYVARGPHPAALGEPVLLEQCDVIRQRRSGPGGQHRNKVETAIRLTHRPTGVTSEASERRSQAANLSVAVRRLRINLALDVRHPVPAEPSALWRRRCVAGTVSVSVDHADFPALLAEGLDTVAASDWQLPAAAARLGCRSSQLVKLLQKEPRGLGLVNGHRRAAGLPPLR